MNGNHNGQPDWMRSGEEVAAIVNTGVICAADAVAFLFSLVDKMAEDFGQSSPVTVYAKTVSVALTHAMADVVEEMNRSPEYVGLSQKVIEEIKRLQAEENPS